MFTSCRNLCFGVILLTAMETAVLQEGCTVPPLSDVMPAASAQNQEFIPLWPKGKMPNSKGLDLKDVIEKERFKQVAVPGMYPFFPSRDDNNGGAVLIIPGGGYGHVTYNVGGMQLAKWFNTLGMSAFVLKYRLPHSPDLQVSQDGPLQDAQRAMQLIRANADTWGVDKDRIGTMGSSAGGHLAAMLGTFPDDITSSDDRVSKASFVPDFLILVSPVISMVTQPHKGSRDNLLGLNSDDDLLKKYSAELRVTEKTPASFLVHAANDGSVKPIHSILFAQALMEHGVSVSLHLFPSGGHGINLRNNPGSTNLWTTVCQEWLKEKEIVK